MGFLVNGQWQDRWYDTASTGGRFVRKDAAFRNWVTADGAAGPSGAAGFKAEAGRYHLYVSVACPWALYKAGFATTQEAYEEAVTPLFGTLDWLDERLATRRFLTGDRLSEADIRLFTTLIRFDAVYVDHFKCNLRRIADYPNLSAYTRDIYQPPSIAGTLNFEHIKRHYYDSHRTINPTGIVPLGPVLDFSAPHDRARFARSAPESR